MPELNKAAIGKEYPPGEVEPGVKEWERAYQLEPTNYIYMRNIQAYRDPRKFYSALMQEK